MPNYEKLRQKNNFFDFVNAPENELFTIFQPGTQYDPIFSQVLELAGYSIQDAGTPSLCVGRHVNDHCKKMAHHFVSLLYHVKRMLRNKKVPITRKTKMIDQILCEFGIVSKVEYQPEVVYLSSPDEVEKAKVAFETAAKFINNGDYGSTIYGGMVDLINILTNSLKKIESGEFVNIDFIDMVDIALFNESQPMLELMGDDQYAHHAFNMKIWKDILNTSPYLLWLSVQDSGVVRAYSIEKANAAYRMEFDAQFTDSADVRLKRLNVFNELNLAFGTHETVVPSTKTKTVNKRREHFKKKHKYMNKQNGKQPQKQIPKQAV